MIVNAIKSAEAEIFPVVCCAGDQYVICIPTRTPLLIHVICGDSVFTCSDNGVLKTDCLVQKFTVPRALLDKTRAYTVRFARMLNRKPYRSEISDFTELRFAFSPLPDHYPLHIAHISDTHGAGEAAISACNCFNKTDLLILNGDISSSSNDENEVLLPFDIAHAVTKGEFPCIITRGNHDLRGKLAEKLTDIYPTDHGSMYYTVSFNSVRFLVLDCGEDKDDSHEEYGGTAAFRLYRQKETSFIETVIRDERFTGSSAPLIVLSHIPFPHTDNGEFAIEQPLYAEWCRLIREYLKPAFGLFGHHHKTVCFNTGDPFDTKKIGCPIILGGKPKTKGLKKTVVGAFITLHNDYADVVFVDGNGQEEGSSRIDF